MNIITSNVDIDEKGAPTAKFLVIIDYNLCIGVSRFQITKPDYSKTFDSLIF
jgi:hypothetical protein